MGVPEPSGSGLRSLRALTEQIWRRKAEVSFVSLTSYAILALTFAVQVITARLLGPQEFGIYSTTLALVALAEVPLIVRGSELALRRLGSAWTSKNTAEFVSLSRAMLHHDLKLYFGAYLLMTGLVWTLHGMTDADPLLFTILALVIPAQAGYGVFKSNFVVFHKVREMVTYEFVYATLLLCLNLAGLLAGGMYGLAASMVVASGIKTVLAYGYTKKYIPPAAPDLPNQDLGLARDSFYPVMRNLFSGGLNHIDIVMLGFLQKPEVVAVYRVGKSIASLPIKIGFPVWHYLQPRLVEAIQRGDRRRERKVILAGSAVLVAVFLVLLLPVLLFGEFVVVLLYGEEYRSAFEQFLILVVGVWALQGVTGWFKIWAVVSKSQRYGIQVYAAAFFATIILGMSLGGLSPIAMSLIVTSVSVALSIAAFIRVLRR